MYGKIVRLWKIDCVCDVNMKNTKQQINEYMNIEYAWTQQWNAMR